MILYRAEGVMRYSFEAAYGFRLVAEVEQDLADYYRALIPKYHYTERQRHGAHVSVVRHETPANPDAWGRHEGRAVKFYYDPVVREGTTYWWLNVFSTDLEAVRAELGLWTVGLYNRPPHGFTKFFHITVGNKKGVAP